MTRVVVLGATGLLGAAVARRFVAAGDHVECVARTAPAADRRVPGATYQYGDVTDAQLVSRMLTGADVVVYGVSSFQPGTSIDDPLTTLLAALRPLENVLSALRDAPSGELFFFSSGGTVYGEPRHTPIAEDAPCQPISAYGINKLTAEHYVHLYARRYGFHATVLRVGNAYGRLQPSLTGQGLIESMLCGARDGTPVTVFGDGLAVRDYVDADDVALAVAELARRRRVERPTVLNVGTGTGHTVLDVLSVATAVTGRAPTVVFAPPRAFDVARNVLDTTLLGTVVEWHPRPLAEGMGRLWQRVGPRRPRPRPAPDVDGTSGFA